MHNNDGIKTKGQHLFSVCDVSSPEAQTIQKQIENVIKIRNEFSSESVGEELSSFLHTNWLRYQELIQELHSKFLKRQILVENITTTAGRTVLARRLSGNTVYTGSVNYTALGTSNAAPAITDTQLGTETYRKALSSGTYLNNVAYLETFFSASEVSGTFQEYGNVIDGTASANTGVLFNRFTQAVTKSATETLNVQSVITLSDV